MKVCIIQPKYSADFLMSDLCFEEQLKLIDMCDESMDIIVLPEACDVPAFAKSPEDAALSASKFIIIILD